MDTNTNLGYFLWIIHPTYEACSDMMWSGHTQHLIGGGIVLCYMTHRFVRIYVTWFRWGYTLIWNVWALHASIIELFWGRKKTRSAPNAEGLEIGPQKTYLRRRVCVCLRVYACVYGNMREHTAYACMFACKGMCMHVNITRVGIVFDCTRVRVRVWVCVCSYPGCAACVWFCTCVRVWTHEYTRPVHVACVCIRTRACVWVA